MEAFQLIRMFLVFLVGTFFGIWIREQIHIYAMNQLKKQKEERKKKNISDDS